MCFTSSIYRLFLFFGSLFLTDSFQNSLKTRIKLHKIAYTMSTNCLRGGGGRGVAKGWISIFIPPPQNQPKWTFYGVKMTSERLFNSLYPPPQKKKLIPQNKFLATPLGGGRKRRGGKTWEWGDSAMVVGGIDAPADLTTSRPLLLS